MQEFYLFSINHFAGYASVPRRYITRILPIDNRKIRVCSAITYIRTTSLWLFQVTKLWNKYNTTTKPPRVTARTWLIMRNNTDASQESVPCTLMVVAIPSELRGHCGAQHSEGPECRNLPCEDTYLHAERVP
jgi:hypothetical protein